MSDGSNNPAQPAPTSRKPKTRREPYADAPLSENEFCRRYNFSRGTVRKYRRMGMPYIQIGKLVRIEPARALEWMRARTDKVQTKESAS